MSTQVEGANRFNIAAKKPANNFILGFVHTVRTMAVPCEKASAYSSRIKVRTSLAMVLASGRLRREHAPLAKAMSGTVPRTSRLIMKPRILGLFSFVCSRWPREPHGTVLRRLLGPAEVVFAVETPCFEGVGQCESCDGKYPTALSRSGCYRGVPPAGSLIWGR